MTRISALNYNTQELDSLRQAVQQANNLADRAFGAMQWGLANPETILSVRSIRGRYILVKRDNRWHRIQRIECYVAKGVQSVTGLYKAIVLEGEWQTKVELVEQLDSSEVLLDLDFTEPSRNKPGSFVAKHNVKIVLPSRDVWRSGKYKAFIMGDEGRYYRAWVI